jgi:hypothetical protein
LKGARRRATDADIRVKRRAGDLGLGTRLVDALERGFEVEVLRQHLIDQSIEFEATEILPKQGFILLRRADAFDIAPAGGQRHVWPLIIGRHTAGRQS